MAGGVLFQRVTGRPVRDFDSLSALDAAVARVTGRAPGVRLCNGQTVTAGAARAATDRQIDLISVPDFSKRSYS